MEKLWRQKKRAAPLGSVHRIHDFQSQLSLELFGGASLEPFGAQVATLDQIHKTLNHVHISLERFESGLSSADSQLESFGVLVVQHGIFAASPFGITVAMATLTSVCPFLNGITHGTNGLFAIVLERTFDVFHVLNTRPMVEPATCELFEQFRMAFDGAANLISCDVLGALGDTEVHAANVNM